MITIMRKHHKVLMIFITGLVCISFSWYWNRTDFSQMGGGVVGDLYGRKVSQVEYQRNARLLQLGSELGLRELAQSLTIGAENENQAYENFSWNLMILRHEADALGIKPTTSEIAAIVKELPAFQGAKGFDLAKYTDFVDRGLAPLGFTEAEIEELAADQIALARVQKLLGSGVSVDESQLRSEFEQVYSKMDVAVVRFKAADFTGTEPNDADITKYYDSHKAQLQTEEKREVKFVSFALTPEQKQLKGKTRIDVLQKLADDANDFTEALQTKGADFDAVAAKFKLAPEETGEFTQAAPDPKLSGSPLLAQSAFGLTSDSPNSEPIQSSDGFYIEHLMKIERARALTPEEARPKIVAALKQERVQAAMEAKATATAKQLRDAMASGKSAEEAVAQADPKAEQVPPFSLLDNPPGTPATKPETQKEIPDINSIKQAVDGMTPGTVSDFVPVASGGMIVVLEKREPLDVARFSSARTIMEERGLRSQEQIVFYEWLRDRRRAAGVPEGKTAPPIATG
jgi:parvulin-like peptidyl-prolyl isomerase